MRYQVSIGEDFDVQAFDVESIDDVTKLGAIAANKTRSKMQERLTYVLLGGFAIALSGAACVGIYDGTFDEVRNVWLAAALPLGYVLRAYFEEPKPP